MMVTTAAENFARITPLYAEDINVATSILQQIGLTFSEIFG
jgi:hypothetical protein